MLFRVRRARAFLRRGVAALRAQQAVPPPGDEVLKPSQSAEAAPDSAWLDLRQIKPRKFEHPSRARLGRIGLLRPRASRAEGKPRAERFRIRLTRPNEDCQILLFRLFFDDKPEEQPELIAWDESGSQVLRSGSLGEGTGLATSVEHDRADDRRDRDRLEVPGDGRSIRGAYLDWMKTSHGDASDACRASRARCRSHLQPPPPLKAEGGRRGSFRHGDRAARRRTRFRSGRACRMSAVVSIRPRVAAAGRAAHL